MDRHAAQGPRYRPYRDAAAIFQIGLSPMDKARWLETGADHAAFMAAKRLRVAGRPVRYYASLPMSRPAQAELLRAVRTHLTVHHAASFRAEGQGGRDLVDGTFHSFGEAEPLESAGLLAEEDFILFERQGEAMVISAASNAYTSSGRIVATVGRGMAFAHDPVPGLNAGLGQRIDRVMANIREEAPVVRFNWFITPIRDRLFPEGAHEANVADSERAAAILNDDFRLAGEMLWLRVERQTFLRLPETGALAFGIHTLSDPLSTLAEDAQSLEAIASLLAGYSEDRLRYSAMWATREPILRWIAERLDLR